MKVTPPKAQKMKMTGAQRNGIAILEPVGGAAVGAGRSTITDSAAQVNGSIPR